jgi:uncharacterized membrane protein
MKKAFIIGIGITLLQFIAVFVAYGHLPNEIPTHWNVSGEVDAYGHKNMIFMIPLLSLVITLGMYYLPRLDPKYENIKKSGRAYGAVMIILNLIMALVTAIILSYAFGIAVPVNAVMSAAIGIMFFVIGYYMPKIKFNYMFGIRLPWTLADETVWAKAHKLGGLIFLACGVLFIAGIFLPAPYNFAVPIAGIFLALIIISVYSYTEYKKYAKPKE